LTTRTKISIKKVPLVLRILDKALIPIMMALGGFKMDSTQETPWHIQNVNTNEIDFNLAVRLPANDQSIYKKRNIILFHAPIFGGWTEYSIFEVNSNTELPFFIGWIEHRDFQNVNIFVHKLPIYNQKIRVLNGPTNMNMSVFAISSDGKQISISLVRGGKLGCNLDANIRLF